MEADRTFSASTSTVTPLLAKPQRVKALPQAFNGFLRNSASNIDYPAKGRRFDSKLAAYNTANTSLVRRLKGRHLQMIAIGGSIGMFDSHELRNIAERMQVLVYLLVLVKLCHLVVLLRCYLPLFSLDLSCTVQSKLLERWQ